MTVALNSKDGLKDTRILAITGSVADETAAVAKLEAAILEQATKTFEAEALAEAATARTVDGDGDAAAEERAASVAERERRRLTSLHNLHTNAQRRLADALSAAREQAQQDDNRALKACVGKSDQAYRDLTGIIVDFAAAFDRTFEIEQALHGFLGDKTRPEDRLPALTLTEFVGRSFADFSAENPLGGLPLSTQRPPIPGAADRKARVAAEVSGRRGTALDIALARNRNILARYAGVKPQPEPVNAAIVPPWLQPGGIAHVLADADPDLSPVKFRERYKFDPSSLPQEILDAAAKLRAARALPDAAPPPTVAAKAAEAAPPERPLLSPADLAKARNAFAEARRTKNRVAVRNALNYATGVPGADIELIMPDRLELFLSELASLPVERA